MRFLSFIGKMVKVSVRFELLILNLAGVHFVFSLRLVESSVGCYFEFQCKPGLFLV